MIITRAGFCRVVLVLLTFGFTLTIRVWGVDTHFWLLEDQIRDWAIAMRPFRDLPLVGPPTHVHGYTIGPAFYWILWLIRVTVGPWFDLLPHAGGIGQAILQSAADALLLVAVWRRTQSPWIALAAVVFLATAAYDLSLASLVWNPVMGSTLAKTALALGLLGWQGQSGVRLAIVGALAWSAVHAYTGAVFVAVGVFAALVAGPASRREWSTVRRNLGILLWVVAALQAPYVIHQLTNRFSDRAMAVVVGGVGEVASGRAAPQVVKSLAGFVEAFRFIEFAPERLPFAGWLLLGSALIVAVRYRHDWPLLALLLLPQVTAIAGYALFLGALDHYYYLSLMSVEVLTILLAFTPVPVQGHSSKAVQLVGVVLMALVIARVPSRIRLAATMHKMPEYGTLVDAARHIRNRHQAMRAIQTSFPLPPSSNPAFLYEVLGGRIDPSSPWVAIIEPDAHVRYVRASR